MITQPVLWPCCGNSACATVIAAKRLLSMGVRLCAYKHCAECQWVCLHMCLELGVC